MQFRGWGLKSRRKGSFWVKNGLRETEEKRGGKGGGWKEREEERKAEVLAYRKLISKVPFLNLLFPVLKNDVRPPGKTSSKFVDNESNWFLVSGWPTPSQKNKQIVLGWIILPPSELDGSLFLLGWKIVRKRERNWLIHRLTDRFLSKFRREIHANLTRKRCWVDPDQ